MWELNSPKPVKLIIGILAASHEALSAAREALDARFGSIDLNSDIWLFDQTDYYKDQTGDNILRQFVSIEELIHPALLAKIKLTTNKIERKLALRLALNVPRPINLDPGIIEPSKLILASTKNFAHRIYIGKKIYAEVTLVFNKGQWIPTDYTFPDYRERQYFDFFDKVRKKLVEQTRNNAG